MWTKKKDREKNQPRVPSGSGAEQAEHAQGEPRMQVAVLDRQRHHDSSEEHHVRLLHVARAHVARGHDAQQRQQHDGYQAGHGQWQRLRHPEHGHHDDHVTGPSRLRLTPQPQKSSNLYL